MKVYQCDRCKKIYEPRRLVNGEPYITHKGNCGDFDLCPECMKALIDWMKGGKHDTP